MITKVSRLLMLFSVFIFFTITANSQPTLEWSHSYGDSDMDWVWDVTRTSDGSVLYAGDQFFADPNNYWVGKVGFDGELDWHTSHPFEFPASLESPVSQVIGILEAETNYLLFAQRRSDESNFNDVVVYPISMTGEFGEMMVAFENDFQNQPDFTTVIGTSDGYLFTGSPSEWASGSQAPFTMVKLNSDFSTSWSEDFVLGDIDVVAIGNVVEIPGTGFAVAGEKFEDETEFEDAVFAMIDMDGNLQWYQVYGDDGHDEMFNTVIQTEDGGFLLAGDQSNDTTGESAFYAVKTDASGNMTWENSYAGALNWSTCNTVIEDWAGQFLFVGATLPEDGDLLNADIMLLKTESSGESAWFTQLGDSEELEIAWGAFRNYSDDSIFLAGMKGSESDLNFWLAKTTDDVLEVEDGNADVLPASPLLLSAWPNPFNGQTRITVNVAHSGKLRIGVYDMLGREVKTFTQNSYSAGTHTFALNADGLSTGIYFVRAYGPDGITVTKKVTLIR